MGYRHNTGQNKTIADATYGTLARIHALAASVCAAAAADVDVDALIGNGGVGVMKISRGIRKEGGGAILIAFAVALLATCISPALASATYVPPDPANLANSTGRYWVNYTWQAGSGWHLIAGAVDGGFYGYNRTGSAWQSDSAIVSDLHDVGNYSAPTVFRKDGTWYLIAGAADGGFYGYNRTGSTWQSDSAIVSDLHDVGSYSAPTVFRNGTWYLIAGAADGGFYGYNRTGSTWQSDDAIVSGLPDVGDRSAPTIFQKDGDWYLIAGGVDAFHGYNWTGSVWQSDDAIASTPPDVENYSAPTVFQKDDGWYLIAGDFHGYNWTGSAWQSDDAIASGLPERDNPTLVVFDMGNVTDSYNISINGSWYNGTTNTSIYTAVSPSRWVNITLWAWNASGTGTLSEVCISDNVQAPKCPNSTFGLVGSVPTGGGDEGTYPPGWFGTPVPAVTATKAPAASTKAPAASTTATAAPPGKQVTSAPTKAKPAAAKAAAPAAEGTTAEAAKKSAPGFTAVFVIAGLLAVAYTMMRRRV